MTLPNILTVLRLLAAPFLGVVYLIWDSPNADYIAFTIFVIAAITDYVDGYLARKWNQVSGFGAMLDPIADKAMVLIMLAVLMGLWERTPWLITIPITVIIFREVAVSGMREYLGDAAKTLKVTTLAKWKTMMQMVAIAVLILGNAAYENYLTLAFTLSPQDFDAAFTATNDTIGIVSASHWDRVLNYLGIVLIWIAALLTGITGGEYFYKALDVIRTREKAYDIEFGIFCMGA